MFVDLFQTYYKVVLHKVILIIFVIGCLFLANSTIIADESISILLPSESDYSLEVNKNISQQNNPQVDYKLIVESKQRNISHPEFMVQFKNSFGSVLEEFNGLPLESNDHSPEIDHNSQKKTEGDENKTFFINFSSFLSIPKNTTEIYFINSTKDDYSLDLRKISLNFNSSVNLASGATKQLGNVQIVTRNGWGCPDQNPSSNYFCGGPFWRPRYNPVSHLIVHHTATKSDATDWPAEVRAIWNYHAKTRDANAGTPFDDGVQGWTDIGYNYLIDPNGVIYEGRFGGEGVTAGHARGHNSGTVGIALLGTYTSKDMSKAMRSSLERLSVELAKRYRLDLTTAVPDSGGATRPRLSGHRDWQATTCPGNPVYNQLENYRRDFQRRINREMHDFLNQSLCPLKSILSSDSTCRYLSSPSRLSKSPGVGELLYFEDGVWTFSGSQLMQFELPGFSGNGIYNYATDIGTASPALSGRDKKIYSYLTSTKSLHAFDVVSQTDQQIADLSSLDNILKIYPISISRQLVLTSSGDLLSIENGSIVSTLIRNLSTSNNAIQVSNDGRFAVLNRVNYELNFYRFDGIKISSLDTAKFGLLADNLTLAGSDNTLMLSYRGSSEVQWLDFNGVRLLTQNTSKYPKILSDNGGDVQFTYSGSQLAIHFRNGNFSVTDLRLNSDPVSMAQIGNKLIIETENDMYIYNYKDSTHSLSESIPVYRFWSQAYQGHFYSSGKYERDFVVRNYPSQVWSYENYAFFGANSSNNGKLQPVYRFWSDRYNSHFYTISRSEKESVESNYPDDVWRYEFVAYYAASSQKPHTKPIHRFWSPTYQKHFFTASTSEKNNVISTNPNWIYEGIAFYAF